MNLQIELLNAFCKKFGDVSVEHVKLMGFDKQNVEHLKSISRTLATYMPSHWKARGVALIDVTRFSAASAPRQMELKLLLDSAMFDARGSLKKLLYDCGCAAPGRFTRLSTGDGYYFFADSIGPEAAAATFCLLALTFAHIAYLNYDLVDLRVRGAFSVGELFLIPYLELWERPPPEPAPYDGIGPVMNSLARIVGEARPGQLLLGEFSGLDNDFTKLFSDPASLLKYIRRVIGTKEPVLEVTKPPMLLRVVDKHGDIYHCYNCAGNVCGWLGATSFVRRVGLVPDDSRRLGETAFTTLPK
jgi:hypothetical protein